VSGILEAYEDMLEASDDEERARTAEGQLELAV
jgi:hypothetical protein